jgi:23S rRNA pseudouridine1911/1915/1917 synthase
LAATDIDIPFDVRANEHGWRADVFLSRRISRLSRNIAADVIRAGKLRRDDGRLIDKPSTKVKAGERLLMKRKQMIEAPTDDLIIDTIFDDEDMLVVNKPGGLVVHPSASAYHRTLIRILRARQNDDDLNLAHRLDKETSGLTILARNLKADIQLKDDFAHRRVEKAYLAVVVGVVKEDEIVVDAPMRLMPDSVSSCLMEVGGENAMPALTEVSVLSRGRQSTLVEARPKTGRQHQIRVHLKHIGHPIIGDKLYLGDEAFFIRALNEQLDKDTLTGMIGHWRQALHAWRVSVNHPRTRQNLTLYAPVPADMQALATKMGLQFPSAGRE